MPANEGAAARLPLYLVRLDWHLLTPVLEEHAGHIIDRRFVVSPLYVMF
jgi:hypothetical protein